MSRSDLTFLAGPEALTLVRDGGLEPTRVEVLAGAAGGPKWLVLSQLDRALFGEWFRNSAQPLPLIGASIGAWRLAAACRKDPVAAIATFEEAYIHQRYSSRPTRAEITRESLAIQRRFLPDQALSEILDHPRFRLHILTVRCRHLTALEARFGLAMGLLLAAGLNAVSSRLLSLVFERSLFFDPRQNDRLSLDRFPTSRTPLTPRNLRPALLASGSIPLVLDGVKGISGAGPGVHRDGGTLDYHLDLPLSRGEGVVLFPHFGERVIPTWFDKKLTWRRPRHLARTLLVAPSREFIASLPRGVVPDRQDFVRFKGRDDERIAYWWKVVQACGHLGEEFLETVASGRVREAVRPM